LRFKECKLQPKIFEHHLLNSKISKNNQKAFVKIFYQLSQILDLLMELISFNFFPNFGLQGLYFNFQFQHMITIQYNRRRKVERERERERERGEQTRSNQPSILFASFSPESNIYFGRISRPIYINLGVNDLSHSMIRYHESERKVDPVSLFVQTGIRTMDLLDRSHF
jgi:hypothetical protein